MFFNTPALDYEGRIYRPPSEARSLLIQVTVGCSHNKCTYCAMYSDKQYRVKPIEQITGDIKKAKHFYDKMGQAPRKIFFCDGDALAAPTNILLEALKEVKQCFPETGRVGVYATADNILKKSKDELDALAENGLSIAYIGLESGSDEILKMIVKGNTAADMVEASEKIRGDWKLSVIVMLGIGGRALSQTHIQETVKVVNQMKPNYFSFLTTAAIPGTPYYKMLQHKTIEPLTNYELLLEMKGIIEGLSEMKDAKSIFRANHVSNQYPIGGVLPRDVPSIIKTLDEWISNTPKNTYPQIDPFSL